MPQSDIITEFSKLKNREKAKASQWFFKTGKGQYGEGDIFWGLTVPQQRIIAKKFADLPIPEIAKLLFSKVHEHRLTGLFILVGQYRKANNAGKRQIADFYLKNARFINNWDLVDSSASYILGNYLLDKDRNILYKLAKSKNLWEKRIAVISTFAFIDKSQFADTIKIAQMLLSDKHDLIHKAVGWALREVGKKKKKVLTDFLDKYAATMPRTMLRYAIEKLNEAERKKYLRKKPAIKKPAIRNS